ncbi:DUF3576 domain-containing protein [Rickettsiales endosymbiont of Peranema trichophorum]|uniref:DUF3576 domain-containing protein n=1 Tax=Rickettsiales endosymbiont of Peranema trichophorum TaxID=2486577 RepID=UPI0013EE4E9A|nr:DUF3576 domain-containing protein [Rickettsiales endosymbiont of Peranema trichophorum]
MKKILYPILISFLTVSCSGKNDSQEYPKSKEEREAERIGKITGKNGIVLFGGDSKTHKSRVDAITVNAYLWRAVLDAVHFMPLLSADPFGGTVITDWYAKDPKAKERFKFNIMIIGPELRVDAVKVSAFKQIKMGNTWTDSQVSPQLAENLKQKILVHARAMRVNDL